MKTVPSVYTLLINTACISIPHTDQLYMYIYIAIHKVILLMILLSYGPSVIPNTQVEPFSGNTLNIYTMIHTKQTVKSFRTDCFGFNCCLRNSLGLYRYIRWVRQFRQPQSNQPGLSRQSSQSTISRAL